MLQFNRLSTFAVAAAMRLLAIPVQAHLIFRFISTEYCSKSDWKRPKLADWLGVAFDAGTGQAHSPSIIRLGNVEDHTLVPTCNVVALEA